MDIGTGQPVQIDLSLVCLSAIVLLGVALFLLKTQSRPRTRRKVHTSGAKLGLSTIALGQAERSRLVDAIPQPSPYRLKPSLLTPAELSFHHTLSNATAGDFTICPMVRLSDLFFIANSEHRLADLNRINQKHIDFILCDPQTMRPRLAIELDDLSHSRPSRASRDRFLEDLFRTSYLPLLRLKTQRAYSAEALEAEIAEALRSTSSDSDEWMWRAPAT